LIPTRRSRAFPIAFSAITGRMTTRWMPSITGVTRMAERSADCRASDLGIISPTTMWK
jgi:hypothetical protein